MARVMVQRGWEEIWIAGIVGRARDEGSGKGVGRCR